MTVSANFDEHNGGSNSNQGLLDLISTGRKLLQAQPMDRDRYQSWSETARKQLAERFGPTNPKVREFIISRREISTPFELDPSYHLTQIGANLRRELKVLEKFSRDADASPAAASTPPTRAGAAPPAARTTNTAAVKKALLVADRDSDLAAASTKTANAAGCVVEVLGAEKRKTADSLRAAMLEARPSVVIYLLGKEAGGKSKSPSLQADAAFELGLAAGVVSPQRVIAVSGAGIKIALPAIASGISQIEGAAGFESALSRILQKL